MSIRLIPFAGLISAQEVSVNNKSGTNMQLMREGYMYNLSLFAQAPAVKKVHQMPIYPIDPDYFFFRFIGVLGAPSVHLPIVLTLYNPFLSPL